MSTESALLREAQIRKSKLYPINPTFAQLLQWELRFSVSKGFLKIEFLALTNGTTSCSI